MHNDNRKKLSFSETVTLMAVLMSLVALSIDMILPALDIIFHDYQLENHNHIQFIIVFVFIGLSLGQLLFGPLSDNIGRKKAVYIGLIFFIGSSLISVLAQNFMWMLIGRFFQGIGASSPRVVTVAMVRDQYHGHAMAQIMSIIMMIFIMVPAIAPLLGKLILTFAIIIGMWFYLTHPKEKRIKFTFNAILRGVREVISHRTSIGYTMSAAFIFGAFMGFLNSVQLIFDKIYLQADNFPYYFAVIALTIGTASAFNSRAVVTLGMRFLCYGALAMIITTTIIYLAIALFYDAPPLMLFMSGEIITFFCMGILFGNFNSLAMEPMGHIAGLASSIIGSIITFISMAIGILIGQLFDQKVLPLLLGFAVCSIMSVLIMLFTEYRSRKYSVK